ncbi:MAG: hypothetical protein HFE83_05390 [Lachnospiraceae bacterium]|jgi:hypothetical protein|nr:hypothetical protein [Lachnospiraceae bacterium]
MLYQYLLDHYETDEPIFLSDIKLPSVSDTSLRQSFKMLCDAGKLLRYEAGVYYFPAPSEDGATPPLSPSLVAYYKYVWRCKQIEGYYSGHTFANQLSLRAQAPYVLEIVSNRAGGKYREIQIGGQEIILRRPRVTVTDDNYQILQFLDLLKDVDEYADEAPSACADILFDYIQETALTQPQLDEYIGLYPDKIYRMLYEMRLYNAFV